MFITFIDDCIELKYGSKCWKCHFSEIVEIRILKKKKSYLFENSILIILTILGYYFAFFSDFLESYFVAPVFLFYTLLLIKRFYNAIEFQYSIILKDIYGKEIIIKIKTEDRFELAKQIEKYQELYDERKNQNNQIFNSIPDTIF